MTIINGLNAKNLVEAHAALIEVAGWTMLEDNESRVYINPACGWQGETVLWDDTEGYVFARDDDDNVYAMTFLELDDEQVPAEIRKAFAKLLGWDENEGV